MKELGIESDGVDGVAGVVVEGLLMEEARAEPELGNSVVSATAGALEVGPLDAGSGRSETSAAANSHS